MQCQCVIKFVIDGLHPIIIFLKQNSFVYKPKLIGCDSPHTMQCQCVIKFVIDGLHPIIIFKKQNSFVYKPKLIGCYTLNDHFTFKTMCLLWAVNFRGLTVGSTHLPTFFGLSLLECMNQYRVFHPRECLAILAITRHKFFYFIQQCDYVELHQTISSPLINHQMRCLISTMHSHP